MFTLQKLIFSTTRIQNIKNLYYSILQGEANVTSDGIFLVPQSKISFNTYFNSFFESYWREYTALNKIKIKIEVQGKGTFNIFRDSQFNGCYELCKQDFETETMRSIIINLSLEDIIDDQGRLFIDLFAHEFCHIKSIEILSDQEEITKKLSIGICTFNREDYLYKNLLGLSNLAKEFNNLSKIYIVNQGNPFVNQDLINLLEQNAEIFQVHNQGNLGGTGGFTRTLYEAVKYNISDYHLLMDDDVIIDTNVIRTAFNFISTATKPIAVGGQMLDILRPNVLHEYGARVNSQGYIRPILHNINVSDYSQLYHFNKVTHIDYNAWWFCMIPTKAIKDIDLPAPIFIRGDDEEYGLRLKQNGIETVGLPGVALWHEPFYVKVGGWQTYYDFRNRLILANSYDNMKNESASRLFLRVYNLLLVHDYQSVKLILEAIKDFSKGPELFTESSEVIHSRVSKIAKDYAPKSIDVNFSPIADKDIKAKWGTNERRMNFAKQIALLSTLNFAKKSPIHLWDRHVNPQNVNCYPYIKSNGIQSYHYLYQPEKVLFRDLLKEIIETQKIYTTIIHSNKWNSITEYKKPKAWDNIFKKYVE